MEELSFDRSSAALIENYGRLPIVMQRGEGPFIFDNTGKRYIDFFVGFGGGGVAGHCHPRVVEAIQKQSETLLSHGNLFSNEPQVLLAEKLVEHSFPGKVFYCHSGAEADEAALKLCRRAAGEGRYKIIAFHGCFHGRTMGGLSLCPPSFQESFEPMLAGAIHVPFGDLNAVEEAIDDHCAGIFVEPIQGEGGVNVPSPEFLQGLRDICDKNKLLLVCDEVWTAPARTGKYFAYQHFGIEPDVITVAKALGGGTPLAAVIARENVQDVLTPGTHGCTMGGNPLCTAAGLATLKLIEDEKLDRRAEQKGQEILEALQGSSPLIKNIRGKGLMLGLELSEEVAARDVMLNCIESGLLVAPAKQNVLRLAPALTTPDGVFEEALAILGNVLKKMAS